jgi:hypothetical protein
MQCETQIVGTHLPIREITHDLGVVGPHITITGYVVVIHTLSSWKQCSKQEEYSACIGIRSQRHFRLLPAQTTLHNRSMYARV